MKRGKMTIGKKLFNRWLKKEWAWISVRPEYPSGGGKDTLEQHHSFEQQLEKLDNLREAYGIAITARSMNEIRVNKDRGSTYYWAWLNLKDYLRTEKLIND